jgi:hypothetical protein
MNKMYKKLAKIPQSELGLLELMTYTFMPFESRVWCGVVAHYVNNNKAIDAHLDPIKHTLMSLMLAGF